MNQEQAIYCSQTCQPPLAGIFEQVLQRVAAAIGGEPERILAALAASLLNSEEINLIQIERLPDEADRLLCFALFDYCMTVGVTEDERREASAAFAPFVDIHAPGTRH